MLTHLARAVAVYGQIHIVIVKLLPTSIDENRVGV